MVKLSELDLVTAKKNVHERSNKMKNRPSKTEIETLAESVRASAKIVCVKKKGISYTYIEFSDSHAEKALTAARAVQDNELQGKVDRAVEYLSQIDDYNELNGITGLTPANIVLAIEELTNASANADKGEDDG